MPAFPPIPASLPSHIKHGVSWESDAKAVANTTIDTMESGAQHAYVVSDKDWYDVTYIMLVYYDSARALGDAIDAFYTAHRLAENITFACKGHRYLGMMTDRPAIEKLKGFGVWRVSVNFRAERTGAV